MTQWERAIRTILFVLVLVCSTSAFYGQAVYGSITGTVYDSSGGAVPSAKVTITDLGRDQNYLTTANQDGYYSQAHLIAGQYIPAEDFFRRASGPSLVDRSLARS